VRLSPRFEAADRDPDQAEPYADRAAWEAMQEAVVSRIEALR
jgi:hypothetical protein